MRAHWKERIRENKEWRATDKEDIARRTEGFLRAINEATEEWRIRITQGNSDNLFLEDIDRHPKDGWLGYFDP